jgi:ATP synthase protein I
MVPPLASPGDAESTASQRVRLMTEDDSPPPPDKLATRLRDLRKQVDGDKGVAEDAAADGTAGSAMGLAFRVGIELAAGLFVGGGLGWLLDRWWHTSPVMLILLFFLGAAAGMVNVFRTARDINRRG